MDRAQLHEFERLHGQLVAAKAEIDGLAGKGDEAPKEEVGALKLGLLDRLIAAADRFLGDDRPFEFAGFGEANATLSDVGFVLGQYVACLESFRADHLERRHGTWYWRVEIADAGGPRIERVPVERYEPKEAGG